MMYAATGGIPMPSRRAMSIVRNRLRTTESPEREMMSAEIFTVRPVMERQPTMMPAVAQVRMVEITT